jgi:gp16 family phage-associated protein
MDAPYPLPINKPYSSQEVKAKFLAAGVTISSWAKANGYSRHKVYFVINGQLKGHWGSSHDIAVALGMKLSVAQIAA